MLAYRYHQFIVQHFIIPKHLFFLLADPSSPSLTHPPPPHRYLLLSHPITKNNTDYMVSIL